MSNNQDLTNISLLPQHLRDLHDHDQKVGKIKFTKDELLLLSQLVGTPVWDLLKGSYAKQRYTQLAFNAINVSQTEAQLMYHKGMASESNQFVKEIEKQVKQFNEEQKPKENS